jgi:hypothetical protein
MIRNAVKYSLVAAALALAACDGDDVLAPQLVAPNLGTCTNIQVPANVKVSAHVFATGVQVYRWDGAAWVLITPSAILTTDEAYKNTIGMHYAGPTWEGLAGSKVTATAGGNCTPDANAIPWLLLNATATDAAGVFEGATHIHRVNTTGGRAPVTAGTAGQVVSVAYTAEYYFYRPE